MEKFKPVTKSAIESAIAATGKGKGAIQTLLHSACYAAFQGNAAPMQSLYDGLKASRIMAPDLVAVARWIRTFAPVYVDKDTKQFKVSTNRAGDAGVMNEEEYWAWATQKGAVRPFYEIVGDQADAADREFAPDTLSKMLETLVKKCTKQGYDEAAALIEGIRKEATAAANLAKAKHASPSQA